MTTDTPELARTRAALDAAEKDHSTALAQEEHAKDQHAEAREQYGAAPNDANGSAVREADHALSLAKVRSSATLARVERARADHQGAEEAQLRAEARAAVERAALHDGAAAAALTRAEHALTAAVDLAPLAQLTRGREEEAAVVLELRDVWRTARAEHRAAKDEYARHDPDVGAVREQWRKLSLAWEGDYHARIASGAQFSKDTTPDAAIIGAALRMIFAAVQRIEARRAVALDAAARARELGADVQELGEHHVLGGVLLAAYLGVPEDRRGPAARVIDTYLRASIQAGSPFDVSPTAIGALSAVLGAPAHDGPGLDGRAVEAMLSGESAAHARAALQQQERAEGKPAAWWHSSEVAAEVAAD